MTAAATTLPAHGLAIERAIRQAGDLVRMAESFATVLAELGDIRLPSAATPADSAQLRAVASLYLASTLEAAGVIDAAEDLTRLARTGGIGGDVGDAGPLIEAFWQERNHRASSDERLSMFGRLFGAPAGPPDASAAPNAEFEEALLDLCDANINAADRAANAQARVRTMGLRLAENLAGASNDMTLMLAREVLDTLSKAIAILNHPQVKTRLMARTLWDSVAKIDRQFRRPPRSTLTHLRRGRAGMAVLAWLADVYETLETRAGLLIEEDSPVVDAAIDWIDETLSLADEDSRRAPQAPSSPPRANRDDWAALGG
jgi:hypothetical protein